MIYKVYAIKCTLYLPLVEIPAHHVA